MNGWYVCSRSSSMPFSVCERLHWRHVPGKHPIMHNWRPENSTVIIMYDLCQGIKQTSQMSQQQPIKSHTGGILTEFLISVIYACIDHVKHLLSIPKWLWYLQYLLCIWLANAHVPQVKSAKGLIPYHSRFQANCNWQKCVYERL